MGVQSPVATVNYETCLWFSLMVLSRGSVALVMRIRLVSVVGEFLWSGEWPVDDDVQCFPGGH